MKLQINTTDTIGEEFKLLAKDNDISHQALFEFLWIQFVKSGSPQTRAGRLTKIEKKS